MLTGLPDGRAEPSGGSFRGPRLLARVGPFAAVAVTAELSLALPPGPSSPWAAAASVALLVLAALGFALPWSRWPLTACAIASGAPRNSAKCCRISCASSAWPRTGTG